MNIYMSKEIEIKLKALAERERRSCSDMVRILVEDALAKEDAPQPPSSLGHPWPASAGLSLHEQIKKELETDYDGQQRLPIICPAAARLAREWPRLTAEQRELYLSLCRWKPSDVEDAIISNQEGDSL